MRLISCCGRSGRSGVRWERISSGPADRARFAGPRRPRPAPVRTALPRRYAMCPPVFFATCADGRDCGLAAAAASAQWERLREVLIGLGHEVGLVPGRPGLPGMVPAAHAATVVDGRVLAARFRGPGRSAEVPGYLRWFAERGFGPFLEPVFPHEGALDLVPAGRRLLAAEGGVQEAKAAAEASAFLGLPVVPLRLANPPFARLGRLLAVLDATTIAYLPEAFTPGARGRLARLFPERIEVPASEVPAGGLDLLSDGRNVLTDDTSPALASRLARHGFSPIELDMSEFAAHGAGVRGCVLELRGGV